MKVAIIGAGAAGLVAARHCLEHNLQIDIFEQTGCVGGTWQYTDCVGVDEYGLPVHSSMYKGLRTNLPKEVMSFEGFPYPSNLEISYIEQEHVLAYIKAYADHFKLKQHIKFFKHVINIEFNHSDNVWLVEVEDSKTKVLEKFEYDFVMICIGHYCVPNFPIVKGLSDKFKGNCKHSHDYRSPEGYDNKKVLIIGSGPSGLDISKQISTVAKKVYVSHRSGGVLDLPPEIMQKATNLTEILNDKGKVLFDDGSVEEIDDILFCTGYKYSYPFLSESCAISVIDGKYVHPLYKHVINIEHPTMGFIGIPFKICPFPSFDIQVRFFISTVDGHFKLPNRENMLKDLNNEWEKKKCVTRALFHEIGEEQGEYFDDLARTANIKKISPAISKLFLRVRMKRDLKDCFIITNDDNFIQIR